MFSRVVYIRIWALRLDFAENGRSKISQKNSVGVDFKSKGVGGISFLVKCSMSVKRYAFFSYGRGGILVKISVFHERGAPINISSISPLQIFSKSTGRYM